jgi:hypothetical protein
MFWMSYAFCWVICHCLNFICQRFATLCLYVLDRRVGTYPPAKMELTECSETLTYWTSDVGESHRRKHTAWRFVSRFRIILILVCASNRFGGKQMLLLISVQMGWETRTYYLDRCTEDFLIGGEMSNECSRALEAVFIVLIKLPQHVSASKCHLQGDTLSLFIRYSSFLSVKQGNNYN